MNHNITFDIACSLKDALFFNGHPSKIKKVILAGKEVWRVFVLDIITVDVYSPREILIYTTNSVKALNSEYTARNYILSRIIKNFSKTLYQNCSGHIK